MDWLTYWDQRLTELSSNCTVSFLIVYATICATYLCLYQTYVSTWLLANVAEALTFVFQTG